MNRILIVAACIALAVTGAFAEDELALSTATKPAPDTVAEEIRVALSDTALILSNGTAPVWEFWFRKSVPLPNAPEAGKSALDVLEKTTLLGVLQLHSEQRDFKDNAIEKGVYTLRYAMQPEDGNHMGTATSPHFLIFLPVSFDKTLDTTMGHDKMAKESMASSIADHPMNLNMQPLTSPAELPSIGEGTEDSKLLQVDLSAEANGATYPLQLGVVFKGKGHIQ